MLYLVFAVAWVVLTVGTDVALRRRLRPMTRSLAGPSAAIMLTVLANLYAILVAFVIVQGWTSLRDAQAQVGHEATALTALFEDSHAFSAADATAVQQATVTYARSVLRDDWPSMKHNRGPSATTTKDYHAVVTTLQNVQVVGGNEPVLYNEAVARLNDAAAARRARLDAARGTLPTPLYLLLVGGGVAVVALAGVLDSQHRRAHLVVVSIVAVVISANLALVVSFDHPFSGSVHVSQRPLNEMLTTAR